MKNGTVGENASCYIVGGGLASLASAAYLLREGAVGGEQICIFEEAGQMGGSLDAVLLDADQGYSMRGFRMLEENVYSCMLDLLSFIPSLECPGLSAMEEFKQFNERVKVRSTARLVENGDIAAAFPFDLNWQDRFSVLWVLTRPESSLKGRTIESYFTPAFLRSNFWLQFCTTFSFQPWHSLVEFRRYILRFIQAAPQFSSMDCVKLMPRNEYDSVVLPIKKWLEQNGVRFVLGTTVVDLDFADSAEGKWVRRMHCLADGQPYSIELDKMDLVFATLGSMASNSSTGTMDRAPERDRHAPREASWRLWEAIAGKAPGLGRPSAFTSATDKSEWVSFTVTFKDKSFVQLLEGLTDRPIGEEGVVTLKSSAWLLSFAMTPHPFFPNQPAEVNLCWGYGLCPGETGNFVRKRMLECTGREILTELCLHLGFAHRLNDILSASSCIPCLLPYITSQFLPRTDGDRPAVLPEGIRNLACLGQYCDISGDIVFTLEYSVRSAQTAVYSMLNQAHRVTPIYRGYRDPRHVCGAIRTVCKRCARTGVPETFTHAAIVRIGARLAGCLASFRKLVTAGWGLTTKRKAGSIPSCSPE
jgi:oleate hydratase